MLVVLEAAASQDLTVLETAREELGASADALSDASVLALIGQASAACARYCGRTGFGRERVRQTEFLHPWERPSLPYEAATGIVLERDLAPEIISVTDGSTELAEDDWMLDGATLLRASGGICYGWRWGGPVVVEYRAGFVLLTDLPPDIERACLTTLRALHFSRGRDPYLRSESQEGVGLVSYATGPAESGGPVPAEAAGLLNPWRRSFG